jgi:hypothetical protein
MLSTIKKFPKKLLVLGAIILLIVASSFIYVYAFHGNLFGWQSAKNSPSTINYGPATSDQQKNGSTIKSNGTSGTSGSDQPSAPTTVPGSSQKSVSVTITAANQNGQTLQVRVLIGVVENTGTCTLTLTQVGQTTVTKTAAAQPLASTSTCKGFDVPISELSTGIWHVNVTYNSTAFTGAATRDVTIQ